MVWELKPKKKGRWKTLSTKDAEMLEGSFREYIESAPVDNAIVDLENSYQVNKFCLFIFPKGEIIISPFCLIWNFIAFVFWF